MRHALFVSVAVMSWSATARAAGYHALKLGGVYGVSEQGETEAGFSIFPLSDDVGSWMTFGDPAQQGDGQGFRMKQWWVESGWNGVRLGAPPPELTNLNSLRIEPRPWLFDYSYAHMGADRTTRRRFVLDRNRHLVFSVPGLWDTQPRDLHFGPTAGIGVNATWWRLWRDHAEDTVMTGKLTGQAGWVLGGHVRETVYASVRANGRYDLFGVHQVNANVLGVVGVFLGRWGQPFGVELRGEADHGDDTVDLETRTVWTAHANVYVKARASRRSADPEIDALLKRLEELEREAAAEPQDEAELLAPR